ncbi:Nucleoside-diphosphate-sugar epimerase [Gaiella occulta]|uniref:Nucleoside-diphosphate-sugar epimerase n=1 Tax=Gaiella occulta TaxID=1002870 RepID=A0A7M2YZP2_9ACTN|nr:NAD-dependent epimerase/dehydratase family protein [Gaiella occulta]RDI75606.1 Nucleoside-diphosphate-sugar epimerase [Gaiella occulta]
MILVTGATGFVGRHVVAALASEGRRVRALVRDAAATAMLDAVDCELAHGDVTDPASLREATEGVDAVVHLVAIIAGRPADFERVMVQGTAAVIAAAQEAGARRLVYMSALGTSEETKGTVPYYRAKWECEQAVAAAGIPHAILRPSFVFGADGGALPRFLRIARLAPVTPVVGPGRQRLQPIWVDDVARAVVLASDRSDDLLVELGGPEVVDWNGLWRAIKEALGTRRPTVHIPALLMRAPALVLERLPDPPLTRDQLTMLGLGDNVVCDGGAGMAELGLHDLVPLDEQLRRAAAARQPTAEHAGDSAEHPGGGPS